LSETSPAKTNQAFRNLRALLNWAWEKSATEEGVYTLLPINLVSHMLRKSALVKWNPQGVRQTRIPKPAINDVWLVLEELSDPDTQKSTTCVSAWQR
jgi:hypothetical protein